MFFVTFKNMLAFCGEVVGPMPYTKQVGYPLSAVREYLVYIITAILHLVMCFLNPQREYSPICQKRPE